MMMAIKVRTTVEKRTQPRALTHHPNVKFATYAQGAVLAGGAGEDSQPLTGLSEEERETSSNRRQRLRILMRENPASMFSMLEKSWPG